MAARFEFSSRKMGGKGDYGSNSWESSLFVDLVKIFLWKRGKKKKEKAGKKEEHIRMRTLEFNQAMSGQGKGSAWSAPLD